MDFYEIEGIQQFKRFGIPVNNYYLLSEDLDIGKVKFPCIIKGQILSGKRGKAGAIKKANSMEDLLEKKHQIEQITINGKKVTGVAAADLVSIKKEFYIGITYDYSARQRVLIFSAEGGMDIEELAESNPDKIIKIFFHTNIGKGQLLEKLNQHLQNNIALKIADIAEKLVMLFNELDATTVEINPLALLEDDTLMAIDSKLVIDDNALSRQGDYTLLPRNDEAKSAQEIESEKFDLTYVEIDNEGNIGTMAGGAGIGMATIDTINFYGGKVNNFLDLGGGVTSDKTYNAMRILLSNSKIEYILVNIFGGINNCKDMAEGIKKAYMEVKSNTKVVVKSRGFNQENGWAIYDELGFKQVKYGTTDEAVKKLLEIKEV